LILAAIRLSRAKHPEILVCMPFRRLPKPRDLYIAPSVLPPPERRQVAARMLYSCNIQQEERENSRGVDPITPQDKIRKAPAAFLNAPHHKDREFGGTISSWDIEN